MLTHYSNFSDYVPKEGNFFHRVTILDKSMAPITQIYKVFRDFESTSY